MLGDLFLPKFEDGFKGGGFFEDLIVDDVFEWGEYGLVGLVLGFDKLLEVVLVDLDHGKFIVIVGKILLLFVFRITISIRPATHHGHLFHLLI